MENMINKTPKVVSVGCVGLWKHNGVFTRVKTSNGTSNGEHAHNAL